MTKKEIIDMFKDACRNPLKDQIREKAIKYQRNRKFWQIEYGDSAIRIQTNGETFIIMFWEHYSRLNTRFDADVNKRTKPVSNFLSKQEYGELEGLYCNLMTNIIL